MPLTTYAKQNLQDHLLGITAYTKPTSTELALFTVVPTVGGGGTEVIGGSYARQTISWNDTDASGNADNDTVISFAGMPACDVVGAAIYDQAGNMLRYYVLPATHTYLAGQTASIAIGDLISTMT